MRIDVKDDSATIAALMIDYNGGLKVNKAKLNALLRE